MPTITVKPTIHVRLKHLAIDAGTTIGQLAHDFLEDAIDMAEKGVSELKKKTKAGKSKLNQGARKVQ